MEFELDGTPVDPQGRQPYGNETATEIFKRGYKHFRKKVFVPSLERPLS